VVSALYAYLAFVTKCRRGVPDADTIPCCQDAIRKAGGDFGAGLREFNDEHDHVHLLGEYPPKVPVPAFLVPVLLRRTPRPRTAEHHPAGHRAAKTPG
jgi:REP element-mobilizing transposase RayT